MVSDLQKVVKHWHPLDGLVKHRLEVPLREGRALHVLDSLDILVHLHALLVLYRRHLALSELLADLGVVAQIQLCADQDEWDARGVMLNLWIPLDGSAVSSLLLDGHTFALTLSNEEGDTMEKQIRKTSVCGYESGRSRS